MLKNNENKSFCFGCGNCCKQLPGIVHPEDLGEVTKEKLIEMFNNGFQFDYWEGNLTGQPEHDDITFYYLRPQTKKSVGKMVDASWGGECVFLTETGCSKTFTERPTQCRALVPKEDKKCSIGDQKYSKSEMIKDWLPYNQMIKEVIDEHYGY
jgi:Fe-S-cluster containining protein